MTKICAGEKYLEVIITYSTPNPVLIFPDQEETIK
jgi:hypothetical protein